MMVAMKEGENLFYFASDHLSSASLVMNDTGGLLSENRYMPFGEVRDISGVTNITQTDFGYTGQRNLEDIGLMDYKARFYSPTLMRFIQPDTIVGNPSNPQSYNRYSYVNNSPIMYIDPTGHLNLDIICPGGMCGGSLYTTKFIRHFISRIQPPSPPPPDGGGGGGGDIDDLKDQASQMNDDEIKDALGGLGITVYDIKGENLQAVYVAFMLLAAKIGSDQAFAGMSVADAFMKVFGNTFDIKSCNNCATPGRAKTFGINRIEVQTFYRENYSNHFDRNVNLLLHELGHAFNRAVCAANPACTNHALSGSATGDLTAAAKDNELLIPSDFGSELNNYNGFGGNQYILQMRDDPDDENEVFADMFLGWTLGTMGPNRSNYMNGVMPGYLDLFNP